MNHNEPGHNSMTTEPAAAKVRAATVVNCDEIFKGAREVKLLHGREEYRLRITKNQKLILTK